MVRAFVVPPPVPPPPFNSDHTLSLHTLPLGKSLRNRMFQFYTFCVNFRGRKTASRH